MTPTYTTEGGTGRGDERRQSERRSPPLGQLVMRTVDERRVVVSDDRRATDRRQTAQHYADVAQQAQDALDARRYRWLRDKSEPGICAFYLSVGMAFKDVRFKPETVDQAIDDQIVAPERAKVLRCPKCGVDRLSVLCPATLDCPLTGAAHGS